MAKQVIRLMCPNLRCRTVLSVPGDARGRVVRCRSCGATIGVPSQAAAAPVVQPTEPEKDAKGKRAG